ncbi:sulfur relay protein TusC/DsrF [secondary endosymbiont of Heteropsylla cubana]|uniref:Sulfur relay protein TusC/DsrF n=1 Tax=secondary endosymbiont of Heteropsylla cubana TaxID=134287 RepID=J3TGU3_9ENTR|nr:sulfurtransferase complex subunit TusC [secondary endosymbiont of Heteropsylla cubana]AFP85737.1 sulfur relay protein TusC/DsrF [secondary endosymbiont of Heteropsylla cubana]
MNKLAFIFSHGPHGKAAGREGLDALLAASALIDDIGVFFISDGVLLLLPQQQPKEILSRDFIATFGLLSVYDLDKLYLCAESAMKRGLDLDTNLILNAQWLSSLDWRFRLSSYNTIITF